MISRILLLVWLLAFAGCDQSPIDAPPHLSIESNKIDVFFTDPLDLQTPQRALASNLIQFLDSANHTLDIAVHSIDDPITIEALERACLRGVVIRFITEITLLTAELANTLREIPCLTLQTRDGSPNAATLMHHKFAVADGRAVWTGSTNWTKSGLSQNANDAVILDNPELAARFIRAVEQLFSENLYGKTILGVDPGPIEIDVSSVSVYFSPSPQLENEIIRQIQRAKVRIRLAMFYYTNDRLHKALLDALSRGVHIQALWGQRSWRQCDSSEIDDMLRLGVGIMAPLPGVLHHKFAIIDDYTVITGSANWTASAFKSNDENILVIQDSTLAGRYQQHFDRLMKDAVSYGKSPVVKPRLIQRNYNTIPGTIRLEWHRLPLGRVEQYEVCRALQAKGNCETQVSNIPGNAWWFIDHTVRLSQTYFYRIRAKLDGRWQPYSDEVKAMVAPQSIPAQSTKTIEREYALYKGRLVTVVFNPKTIFTSQSGNVFIHSSEDYKTDFSAFIPACAVDRFREVGIDFNSMLEKTVFVSGELEMFNGPEITLYDPGQLRFLDNGL